MIAKCARLIAKRAQVLPAVRATVVLVDLVMGRVTQAVQVIQVVAQDTHLQVMAAVILQAVDGVQVMAAEVTAEFSVARSTVAASCSTDKVATCLKLETQLCVVAMESAELATWTAANRFKPTDS